MSYRNRAEQANKVVGLCMDMQALHDLAASSGMATSQVLTALKKEGLTAVTMSADSLNEMIQRQELGYTSTPAPILTARSPELADRVRFGLTARFGPGPWQTDLGGRGLQMISVSGLPFDSLLSVSLGLPPQDAKLVRTAGLQIVARHGNPVGATPRYIQAMLERSRKLGATVYLPEGDQALGQRDLIGETATDLANLDLDYASPEFAKIGGDAVLAEKAQDRLIRLHSIQQSEIDKMGAPDVVERFEKAYRERNIRLLLLRPLSNANEEPVAAAGTMIASIRKAIEHDGGTLGVPVPYKDPGVPKPLFLLIGLAAGAATIWVGFNLFENTAIRGLGTLLITMLALACWVKTGREFMALTAAMAFPIGAYLTLDLAKIKPIPDYARLSAISLVGGFTVAGLLNELPYYIRIDQFPGVKLAHFLPIVIIGAVLIGRQIDWRVAAKTPATWGAALLGIVMIGVLGFMLARTGNDNPAAVSSLELKFRDILDAVLFTRPRTKEFLMGHPALIFGLCLLMWNNRRLTAQPEQEPRPANANSVAAWGAMLLTIGAIGQTSIVNTMCHLHTPVLISISRILIGWVLGGILGGLLWALFQARRPLRQG
jgi:hypothetical protein